MATNLMLINEEYIRGLLDSRGYEADDETVKKALDAWISNIQYEEDNFFITAIEERGVKLKEVEQ